MSQHELPRGYGIPHFSAVRSYDPAVGDAFIVRWDDGFAVMFPLDYAAVEDSSFRDDLIKIVNEWRARQDEARA